MNNYLSSAISYLDDVARQTIIDPTAFIAIKQAVQKAKESELSAIEAVKELFEVAIKNGNINFFRQVSEMKSNGTVEQVSHTQLVARMSLIYYYELLSEGADYQQIKDFIERANSIKNDTQEIIERVGELKKRKVNGCYIAQSKIIEGLQKVIDNIDNLIVLIGQSAIHKPTYQLDGTHHALTASYSLYGDISRAYEIVGWSSGVSGAELSRATYYRE